MAASIRKILKEGSEYVVKGTLWIECEKERFFGPGRVELLQRIDGQSKCDASQKAK